MAKRIISFFIAVSMAFLMASCAINKNEQINETTKIETVKVTIPEGYTLLRISWLLEDKGLCTSDEFINATQNYKDWLDLTKYPFLNDLQSAENVCFQLEGYFFPLTYSISKDATINEIIEIFLNGTKQKFTPQLMEKVKNSGYNLHQILTIASIIEKEAALHEQRPNISSVIHNRLKNNMKIQCDPTVKYCEGVIKVKYPEKFDFYKQYYNTYRCKGLMAGPICNPGIESIESAIAPKDTPYLYFIVGTVPPYKDYYFETFEEHQKFWKENKDRLTGKTEETTDELYW